MLGSVPHQVAVLALPHVIPFELGIPSRIFQAAAPDGAKPLYETVTCTLDGGPVRTAADFAITPDRGPDALDTADTIVIPPAHDDGDPVYTTGELRPEVAAALARIRPGVRVVSICVASYYLAAAGLLDGRRAATHWQSAAHFQGLFPRVEVDADVLYVDDGDLLTSAGVASGIDACLHLIRRDHGSEIANQAARRCVVPPYRDGGQAQYIERPVPAVPETGTTATRAWALKRLDRAVTLEELAAHARMSRRTFTRRFREETGQSPARWLAVQRLDAARRLLESTDLAVDQVAVRTGFGTGTSLRQHMRAAVGVAPGAYRRTFRDRSTEDSVVSV
ncbi:GlxA family transcriptional regulator [Phytomonospora endophytica]|uniref:Transcriptional regulator GlxA family with amidase domain n=1 Tax=Phytomonospora endophytica TaxID=714109 RepID=A0A841FRH5_9ACTN|nr:helix-turn-helix domain-containing protein [Phytomonospora endophytica]MBB6035897.1 transcriptional regulator GlxA family with amidase domain [Phytomonospora endophytica]GIG71107.1 transcriptional regulator [Phytomonospora endophytica]